MTRRAGAIAMLACALQSAPHTQAADVSPVPVQPPSSLAVFPDAPQRELVIRACAACHPPEMVVAKRHTVEEWDEIIAKMVDRGAVATETEQQEILEYLAKFFSAT